jgi:hypothetical protein
VSDGLTGAHSCQLPSHIALLLRLQQDPSTCMREAALGRLLMSGLMRTRDWQLERCGGVSSKCRKRVFADRKDRAQQGFPERDKQAVADTPVAPFPGGPARAAILGGTSRMARTSMCSSKVSCIVRLDEVYMAEHELERGRANALRLRAQTRLRGKQPAYYGISSPDVSACHMGGSSVLTYARLTGIGVCLGIHENSAGDRSTETSHNQQKGRILGPGTDGVLTSFSRGAPTFRAIATCFEDILYTRRLSGPNDIGAGAVLGVILRRTMWRFEAAANSTEWFVVINGSIRPTAG